MIECVLGLFFEFQVMSDVPVPCMCLVLCSHPACCQSLTVNFSCGQTSAVDNSPFNLLTLLSQRYKVANKDVRKTSGKEPADTDALSDSAPCAAGSIAPAGPDTPDDTREGVLVNLVHQVVVTLKLEAFSVCGHGTCMAVSNHPRSAHCLLMKVM